MLAHDERLTLSELLAAPSIEASFALLSACETRASADASGEEALALSSALIASGVTTSIATFFRVPDEASRLLVTRFYHELAVRWESVGDALIAAQRWMLTASDDDVRAFIGAIGDDAFGPALVSSNEALAEPRRKHWYRWAGFAAIGAAYVPASRDG